MQAIPIHDFQWGVWSYCALNYRPFLLLYQESSFKVVRDSVWALVDGGGGAKGIIFLWAQRDVAPPPPPPPPPRKKKVLVPPQMRHIKGLEMWFFLFVYKKQSNFQVITINTLTFYGKYISSSSMCPSDVLHTLNFPKDIASSIFCVLFQMLRSPYFGTNLYPV